VVYTALLQVAESCSLVYPLNHDDVQQYTEIYHYLNNFDDTKITVDITISHIAIMIITLLLLLHSPNVIFCSPPASNDV